MIKITTKPFKKPWQMMKRVSQMKKISNHSLLALFQLWSLDSSPIQKQAIKINNHQVLKAQVKIKWKMRMKMWSSSICSKMIKKL
jgi:hypothetical protein